MGGILSYLLGGGSGAAAEDPADWDEPEPATGLTPRQKHAVVETWALVQPDMKATGVALLIALFEEHPEHQRRFSAFSEMPLSELRNNKKFAAHASSVMHAVASLVDSLDDTACLVELLAKIGRSHRQHRIPPQGFTDLKNVLLKLLTEKLGSQLTPLAAEAWDKTLTVANSVISKELEGGVAPAPVRVEVRKEPERQAAPPAREVAAAPTVVQPPKAPIAPTPPVPAPAVVPPAVVQTPSVKQPAVSAEPTRGQQQIQQLDEEEYELEDEEEEEDEEEVSNASSEPPRAPASAPPAHKPGGGGAAAARQP